MDRDYQYSNFLIVTSTTVLCNIFVVYTLCQQYKNKTNFLDFLYKCGRKMVTQKRVSCGKGSSRLVARKKRVEIE